VRLARKIINKIKERQDWLLLKKAGAKNGEKGCRCEASVRLARKIINKIKERQDWLRYKEQRGLQGVIGQPWSISTCKRKL